MSRFRPPLTADDLNAIQARRKADPDTQTLLEDNKALLLEIARLRASVLTADQFYRSLTHPISCNSVVLGLFTRMLENEPVVQQMRQLTQELLNPE